MTDEKPVKCRVKWTVILIKIKQLHRDLSSKFALYYAKMVIENFELMISWKISILLKDNGNVVRIMRNFELYAVLCFLPVKIADEWKWFRCWLTTIHRNWYHLVTNERICDFMRNSLSEYAYSWIQKCNRSMWLLHDNLFALWICICLAKVKISIKIWKGAKWVFLNNCLTFEYESFPFAKFN